MLEHRILELLKQNNHNKSWLAEQLEVNKGNVTRWCQGQFDPTLQNLLKICEAFKITPNELLEGFYRKY